MHFVLASLLSLGVSVLAGCPNVEKRDNHPGGAAAIESAVTSAYSATNLPGDLATLGPALSSAGITGVVVSDSTYGISQPTPTNNNNNNNNNNNDQNGQNGQNDNNNDQGSSNNDQGNSNNNDQGNSNNDQGNSNDDQGNSNNNNGQSSNSNGNGGFSSNGNGGSRTSDGLSPATSVPQVLMAGAFGALGMAVLGML